MLPNIPKCSAVPGEIQSKFTMAENPCITGADYVMQTFFFQIMYYVESVLRSLHSIVQETMKKTPH